MSEIRRNRVFSGIIVEFLMKETLLLTAYYVVKSIEFNDADFIMQKCTFARVYHPNYHTVDRLPKKVIQRLPGSNLMNATQFSVIQTKINTACC